MSPDCATILQLSTLPRPLIASDITCPPSKVSPFCRSALAGSAFGSNRRSKVIRVYSCFESEECDEVEVIAAAPVSATSQLCCAFGLRLDSYLHDSALPLPAMVTVTFSHQGELATSVSSLFAESVAGLVAVGVSLVVVFGVVAAAIAPPAAEARMRAAITRNTFVLLRARRSGDLIAAAY